MTASRRITVSVHGYGMSGEGGGRLLINLLGRRDDDSGN